MLESFEIYVDGSVLPQIRSAGGCAIIVTQNGVITSSHKKSLGFEISSYTAEISAVKFALLKMINMRKSHCNITIFFDCQSMIGQIETGKKKQEHLGFEEVIALKSSFSSLSFRWLRGHNNDLFNNFADYLAKTAAFHNLIGYPDPKEMFELNAK